MDKKTKKYNESKEEFWGTRGINPICCEDCKFNEENFKKANCAIYGKVIYGDKPDDVYYDGADCQYKVKKK